MRIGVLLLVPAALGFLFVTTAGCMANTCLVPTCEGNYCTCSVSTCAPGSYWDARVSRCRCNRGYVLAGGHCLSPKQAATYCGPGYHFEGTKGCAPNRCRPGDEFDHSTGLCIPHAQVNRVADNLGVSVGKGEQLGCPEGQKLIVDGSRAACVPLSATCARDERWDGHACVKSQECEAGSSWDATQGRCVQITQPAKAEPPRTDVMRWAQITYGVDGGEGAPGFCHSFATKPWSFGVNEGSTVMVRVTVGLSFPDSEIDKGTVITNATFAASGNQVPLKGADEVNGAARSLLTSLVGQGGTASDARVTTSVRCAVINAAKPLAVPATGGL